MIPRECLVDFELRSPQELGENKLLVSNLGFRM